MPIFMQVQNRQLKEKIRTWCLESGFDMVGFSAASKLETESHQLENWLENGFHGEMNWMENHFEKRTDPRILFPGTKTVISVLHNYLPAPAFQQPQGAPKISTYAWGEDYHTVLKRKLNSVLEKIREKSGEIQARVFTDSAPVMDKAWAAKSGLGWIGKNTNLIHPKKGSWFFIGEILLDIEFESDLPIADFCGTCSACLDACPTGALQPYSIDSRKCISYLTIELKDKIPDEFSGQMKGWAYGCDICQDVCPWNRFSKPDETGDFKPLDHILEFGRKEWGNMAAASFRKLTAKTAMSRIKHDKWQSNLAATGDSHDSSPE